MKQVLCDYNVSFIHSYAYISFSNIVWKLIT